MTDTTALLVQRAVAFVAAVITLVLAFSGVSFAVPPEPAGPTDVAVEPIQPDAPPPGPNDPDEPDAPPTGPGPEPQAQPDEPPQPPTLSNEPVRSGGRRAGAGGDGAGLAAALLGGGWLANALARRLRREV